MILIFKNEKAEVGAEIYGIHKQHLIHEKSFETAFFHDEDVSKLAEEDSEI